MIRRLLETLIVKRGRATLACVVLATGLLGAGYAELGWTNDPEVISLHGSDELEFYRGYVERWGSDELIVLAYEVEDAFTAPRLRQLRALTDALLDLDDVAWVSSLDTAFVIDDGPFGPFARPLIPDEIGDAAMLREAALSSPFARDALVSSDGRVLLLSVQLEGTQLDNSALEVRALDGVVSVLGRAEFRELGVHLAGSPVFNRELSRLNQRDNAVFTPVAVAIIALLLALLYRSVLLAALALGTMGVSVVWTLGLMGWLGVPMNITTSLLPPLLMVIAVADSVHVLSAYTSQLASGSSRAEALDWTLREVAPSCFWTTVTTCVGFASLFLVRIESVHTFATFAVIGVCIALLHAVVLLPTVMLRLPLESVARRRALLPVGGLTRLAARPAVALVVLVAASAVAIAGIPRIQVSTHDGEFFSESNPINVAYRFIESRLQGVTPLEVEIRAPSAGAFRSAEGLRGLQRLERSVNAEAEVAGAVSLVDLLTAVSPGLDLEQDAAAERALFLLEALAPGEVRQWLREDAAVARVSARAVAMSSTQSRDLIDRLSVRGATAFPAEWSVRVTGLVPVFGQMEQYLVEGQIRSYGVAVFAIGVLLLWILRSPGLVAAALIANLVPIAAALGWMGLAGIRLDVATIMVASIALGIVVDDTIHLLHALKRGLSKGLDADAALKRALEIAGRPIIFTSLILTLGFASLAFSDFQPTAHFGLLVSAAVCSALVADLVILPTAVLILRPRHTEATALLPDRRTS